MEEKLLTQEDRMTEKEIYQLEKELDGVDENYIVSYIEQDKLFMKMRKQAQVIITLADISEINQTRQEQIDYFVKLSLASSFLIALVLSLSVGILTRKIKQLNKVVKEVEKGNYSAKIKKIGKDEIGNVGKSFNEMTKAVQENIARIQEVAENRKKFIGNLTHEIRTPLTSIVGYSSLIKNRKVESKEVMLEYCDKIYEEGKYIEQISQKLMDLLLLENGRIEKESINLSEELNHIIAELQMIFPEVVFQKEIARDVFVNSDKVLLKSLIVNLAKNAIKAYETSPMVRIELSEKKEIRVIDYGKGIPKEEIEKIKEPFYTLSKDRNRTFSGMGLGLPLCIKIVEVQNGTIEIESIEKEGTKISIKLGEEKKDEEIF